MGILNNVLIIDDDPILRAISQSYFAAHGTSAIFVAGNGKQALQIVAEQGEEIDFILCDLNMPELDGLEFLRHLSDYSFNGSIGIVSGEDASVIDTACRLAQGYDLNIAGTVKKPLNKAEFDQLVENAERTRDELVASKRQQATPEDLAVAVEAGHIVPHYQPKIRVTDGRICGRGSAGQMAPPHCRAHHAGPVHPLR